MTTTDKNCGSQTSELNPPPPGTPFTRDLQRARLAQTREKIQECRAILETLDAEREELEDILETFVYPVLTIPTEIVTHIFLDCLPSTGRVQPSKNAAPLLLAQICRHWRAIALSIPQLWSSVDLTFLQGTSSGGPFNIRSLGTYSSDGFVSNDSPYNGACALIRTWFSRTGGKPLSITLRCSQDREAFPPAILPAIAEFSEQWGRLELCIQADDIPAMARIRGPFPLLYSLAVTPAAGSAHNMGKLGAFRDAPQLRELRLLHGLALSHVEINSTNITTLEVDADVRMSWSRWVAILRRFPRLIHFSGFPESPPSNAQVLDNAPPLQSLIVGGDPLSVLRLPHVRRLQCRPNGPQAFLSFIFRSSCVLQHLYLGCSFLNDDALLECLRAVPSVVKLDLGRYRSAPSLYDQLRSPALLPRLRELSIREAGDEYTFQPVLAMLSARRDPHPTRIQLGSFDLLLDQTDTLSDDESAAPDAGEALQIQRLIAAGLQFRLHTALYKWPSGLK
ncbi:hypothetical protein B0H15DRAFT_376345 [Mycena belliarum]|uniref:F-box domain-containing protein n=1 Tax=Mycena belliarum TaxID=1033014 RepID=A0AAD6U1Y6_9AGAR|nr:hypothetical protein B0H15DRAFT_376345 [Mycena belliae]